MRKLILSIGHSNMCDRADKNLLPAFPNASRMFVYRESDNWLDVARTWMTSNPATFILDTPGYWTPAVDVICPAGSNASQTAGAVNLAMLNAFADHVGSTDEVAVVPHALGGATCDMWDTWTRKTTLYGLAMQRLRWALEYPGAELAGVVVWLGENDCGSTSVASVISRKITDIIRHVRLDTGNLDLPAVIVKPGNENVENLPGWNEMRKQIDWCTLKNLSTVNTDDIETLPGNVHFSTAAYVKIGARIGEALGAFI